MNHVYLSPHLDDAALSCGGAIHRHTAAGESVLVITIFAGEFEGGDLSPFALQQHRQWGNSPQPMALRRAEDTAALTLLGSGRRYLDHLDAVYRADPDDLWMYTDLETLCGEIHPGDEVGRGGAEGLADQLAHLIPLEDGPVVYAPLAVGQHVDHQVVHAAARRLQETGYRLAFYEDYPYAERSGALETALAIAGAENWQLEVIPLDAADLAAKVSALGYYQTQMAVLFGGIEAMPSRVWTFGATRSAAAVLAERVWWSL